MRTNSLCALHLALGEREACPGAACAFWEDGGAVVEPGLRVRSRAARVPRASGRSTLDARPPPVTRGGSLRRRGGKGAERSERSPAARAARIGFRRDTRVGAAAAAGAPRGRHRPHVGALARRRVQRLVETAAELTTARYAALGVIDPTGNAVSNGSSPTGSTRGRRRRSAILRTGEEFSACSSTRPGRFACTT